MIRGVLLLSIVVVLGAGCDRSVPALDAGRSDAATSDASRPRGTLEFADCGDGLECATLTVPLDHAGPDGRTLGLAVTRHPAAHPEERIGVVVIDFGGPGVPTRWALRQTQIQLLFSAARDLRDRFDVVGLDWRGVGESVPALGCGDVPVLERASHWFDTAPPASDADVAAIETAVDSLVDDCAAVTDLELVARMDTTSSARDMELLRVALGEDRLGYLGISYGTLRGSVYASLYPERVRAFVLDSPLATAADATVRGRRHAGALESSFVRFLDWCADDVTCAYREAPDAAGIGAAFVALMAARRAEPLALSDGGTLDGHDVYDRVLDFLYQRQWTALGTFLAAVRDGDGTAIRSPVVSIPDSLATNVALARNAIHCIDTPVPEAFDHDAFVTYSDELAAAFPLTGRMSSYNVLPCASWPVRGVPPSIDAAAAPPLLVVVSRYDPTIPYTDAEALLAELGNGSHLLTYEGDGHGALALSLSCVLPAEVAFLVDPASTPPTSCP